MGIVKINQVICDFCHCAIDYFDIKATKSEIRRKVKNSGAIVEKKDLIFCSEDCKEEYDNINKR